jgi:type I restriction enzyme M protein
VENGSVKPANGTTREIVAKLWSLCHILRDDGITYSEYVTELTFLLFLKMLEETGHEARLPREYRWKKLAKAEGLEQLSHYRRLLLDLGDPEKSKDSVVLAIFADAQTKLRKPTNLKALTDALDKLDWFSAREEGLGNLYEGLLEKNAAEKKSGAGQYFTPRPLIDSIVRLIQPQAGEVIQDPAAGTGGFLVAADRYIKDRTDDLYELSESQAFFQRRSALVGVELVPDTHRLCLMNLMLHGIESMVDSGDTLSPDGERLGKADVILTNPPFGSKRGGGRPNRPDFSVTAGTSNKQLAFVEHVVRALRPGGRAAVVVPDNVLFEENVGLKLRQWMMDRCNVHTILRLPQGIFYAQGVKTNVLFMTRAKVDRGATKGVWVYDMRTNVDSFGKTRPLTEADFREFEAAFGSDPGGGAERTDEGAAGRFRWFSRAAIAANVDSLDLTWLREESGDPIDNLHSPDDVAKAIRTSLNAAVQKVEALDHDIGSARPVRATEEVVPVMETSAAAEIAKIPRLIERYKKALFVSAFRGELTKQWRESRTLLESADDLVARTPPPPQPRGGRVAAKRVIPGVAALSVNDPLKRLPDGWSWVALSRVARQETGHTPSRSRPEWWGGDIPWVGIKDAAIHHGRVVFKTIQSTNEGGLANSAARKLPGGTVCLSRTASVGYAVILGTTMATSQDFVTWSCSPALMPKYLLYALMAEGDDIRRFGKGSTHTTIYFPEVRAMHIALAPLEEQKEIVRRIEQAMLQLDGIKPEGWTGQEPSSEDVKVRSERSHRASARRLSERKEVSSREVRPGRSAGPRALRRSQGRR